MKDFCQISRSYWENLSSNPAFELLALNNGISIEFFYQILICIIKIGEKNVPIVCGKPCWNSNFQERRLIKSSFNQQWGISKVVQIDLKGSIKSKLVRIKHTRQRSGPLWPRWEIINVNHGFLPFAAASFHSRSLEQRHSQLVSCYSKEHEKPRKIPNSISTESIPN